MNQVMLEQGVAAAEPRLRDLVRPLVAVAGAAVSAAWAIGIRPMAAKRRTSSVRARRGRI